MTDEIKKEVEEHFFGGMNEFENDFVSVYMYEPFLGQISLEITKRPDNNCETAYVGIDPKSHDLVMGYNEKFMRSMEKKHRKGVIKHELYHVVFRHLTDRMPVDKNMAVVWNVAADMAINSIIGADNLPDLAIIPGKELKPRKDMSNLDKKFAEFVKNAPLLESAEYYYEEIKNLVEEDMKNGGSGTISVGGTVDSHDMWGKLPDHIRDMIREKIHETVAKAASKADQKNQWGTVPAEIQERVRRMVSREVDWRSVMKNFFGRCRSPERTSTLKKINKKAPYVFPGVRRQMVANFACFIDQSGSVGDEDLVLFFGELESFSNHTELDVYHFDTEVDEKSHTKWKKGRKVEPKRTRCGGTSFAAVAAFLNRKDNKGKWSGCVVLTDGFADKMPAVVGTKILWVITQNGDMSAARPGDLVIQMKKSKQFKNA